ncbi:MAG: hypothetical protein KDE56_01210 [Anaerolineales bacterium]|nr:hypothetical protein [Anaerolineales bacterium]
MSNTTIARFLVQPWNPLEAEYQTTNSFDEKQPAIEFAKWLMAGQNAPEAIRVYDQQEQKVVHQASNIPF